MVKEQFVMVLMASKILAFFTFRGLPPTPGEPTMFRSGVF